MLVGVAGSAENRAARLTVRIFSAHMNGKVTRQQRRTVEALTA
jgi:hypothetical protein